jgi:hypothetical protein
LVYFCPSGEGSLGGRNKVVFCEEENMTELNRSIYETIGAVANTAALNKSTVFDKTKTIALFDSLELETSSGNSYERPSVLVNKAKDYFAGKVKEAQETADNIAKMFL